MASTIEKALNSAKEVTNKIGDVVEEILGVKNNNPTSLNGYVSSGGRLQSPLEKVGLESRMGHLNRNEWNKEVPYSKLLVESEYNVQKEFIV